MTNQALATVPGAVSLAPTTLSFTEEQKALMKATVAKGTTDAEFNLYLQLASAYGLDPFRKEIWAIKRKDNEAALIMTSRDGYLKIAQRDPNYLGIQAAVVKKGDHFKFNPAEGTVEHSFGAERGQIIGAWAIAHHRHRMPVVCFVEFAEYKGNSPTWNSYPSAMIQKVAEVFVLKRQFNINGLVTTEEIDAGEAPPVQVPGDYIDAPGEVVYEDAPTWAPTTAQIRRLYAIAKQHGIKTKDELRIFMDGLDGYPEKEGELTEEQYNALCDEKLPALSNPSNFAHASTEEPVEEDTP